MNIANYLTRRGLAAALLATASCGLAAAGAEFSAESIQRGPQGDMASGKMFMGDKRVRTEMMHQGQQVIRITDQTRGVEWILFPEQKKYMEQKLAPAGGQAPMGETAAAQDPCGGMPNLTCRNLGEEAVSGRTAVKWEILGSHEGQTMKSTQWIDKERGVPLRQEMPDGQTTELKMVATEDLGGRKVEKWEMVATKPNQPETRTYQWYDPELELAVRQEFPGGMVSELKNVRVGKQPDELFNIPAGYERMTAPQGMPEAPGEDATKR